jgi:hypothetical protein
MVVLGVSALPNVWADPVIYSHPSNYPDGITYASQNDTSAEGYGNDATVYDNFTLTSSFTVTDVHGQGEYFNPAEPGTIQSFTIQFWSDNAGQPGNSLLFQSLLGNANETSVGINVSGPVYDYSVDLIVPFQATGGTPYWLSIYANMVYPPQSGWHSDTEGDGVSFQDFLGGRNEHPYGFAFALTGSQVPEPTARLLLGSGLPDL